MSGPLQGVRIVEAGGIGPGPFAAMLLADMGAEVLRIDAPRLVTEGDASRLSVDLLYRSRRSVAIDLKSPAGLQALLTLVSRADGLIEGFRPGVAEKLGFGPDTCSALNSKLVYGRVTGWGQEGPMAQSAGHDINYIALAGVLAHMPRVDGVPMPPLNLVGDFGGGGMLLGFGMACALFEASRSGLGQVVDAAMVDGAALLMTLVHGINASGRWSHDHGTNNLEGYAPSYGTYETADGGFISIGAAEPQFWSELLHRLDLDDLQGQDRADQEKWPEMRARLAAVFRTQTRDEWCRRLEPTDVCFAPVLTITEAPLHPHNQHRNTFVDVGGAIQPAPAPRFSRTPTGTPSAPPDPGQHTEEALVDWGFAAAEVAQLIDAGAVLCRESESAPVVGVGEG